MQKPSHGKRTLVIVVSLSVAAIGIAVGLSWWAEIDLSSSNSSGSSLTPLREEQFNTEQINENSSNSQTAISTKNHTNTSSTSTNTSDTAERVEQGEAPGSGEFSRADFFQPVDWGTDFQTMPTKEPQSLKFNAACKNHPRNLPSIAPAEWAENFTFSQSTQRWPAQQTHVIDWNQFWQLKDLGYQVSIRWNFENPPLYSVVGYSFALNKPDGYGAQAFPEKLNVTWEEAKTYVLNWEKKILNEGGRAGTRTMSLAAKPFNPADVSPEEIERAEYSNSKIRAAQTGKMSCNTLTTDLSQLNCSCWF